MGGRWRHRRKKNSCMHEDQSIECLTKESRRPPCDAPRRMLVEFMLDSHLLSAHGLCPRAARSLSAIALSLFIFGCQENYQVSSARPEVWEGWKDGQIVDARTGRPVPMNGWIKGLAAYDIIYLGEEHHNRYHIDAALLVLRSLIEQHRRPVLAMEMFGWDGQSALNQHLASKMPDRDEFLQRVLWKQNWGGAFEDYEPLVEFAKDHQLPLLALNPPKTLIRQVVGQGLTQVKEQAEWRRWDMERETIVDDSAYRSRIMTQLQDCHGGGSFEDYQRMYEASMVRDEAMAKTLAAALTHITLENNPVQGPVLSYTGGGHVQYGLPVPNRVARRIPNGLRQVTVYLTTFEEKRATELVQAMKEGIADYLWLTPMGAQGPPRRCR